MADFDAILKEVQALRDEHLSLQVLIPKLVEESNGLKQSIAEAQKELVTLEEQQQAIKDKTTQIVDDIYAKLKVDTEKLRLEKKEFDDTVSSKTKTLMTIAQQITKTEDELEAKENELANLLEKQVDGDKALQKALIDLDKRIGDTLLREAKVERETQELEAEKDKVCALVLSLSDEQARLMADRLEVDSMTSQAKGLLKTAENKSQTIAEQNNLLQLRIDEYNRKDELMKTTSERLRKREIALNDKERVYNSH